MSIVLGLHNSFTTKSHDSSASLLMDGKLVAAIEEERLTRRKSSVGYPCDRAVPEVLKIAGIDLSDVDCIAVDGSTYPEMKEKVEKWAKYSFGFSPRIQIVSQSDCHTLGSFLSSGFDHALSIDIEGVGDGVSIKVVEYEKKDGLVTERIHYKAGLECSLGNFYVAFTQYLGMEALEGEFKVMGMAAYGTDRFDLSSFASFNSSTGEIAPSSLKYVSESATTPASEPVYISDVIESEIKVPYRPRNAKIEQKHFDLAASVQSHFERMYVGLVDYWIKKTGVRKVCMSGGCALNAVANMKLLNTELEKLFVMPASSDRGVSLGAAMIVASGLGDNVEPVRDMYLGTSFSNDEIARFLRDSGVNFRYSDNADSEIANEISKGKVIGLFRGRSEFGPRSLGARSIIASPRIPGMKDVLNSKIKFREQFRPFAPASTDKSLVTERADYSSMTTCSEIPKSRHKYLQETIHLDSTARVQLVDENNDNLWNLLNEVKSSEGHPSVINTSFNLKGEPIVNSPSDAIRTFFASGIDTLYIEDIVVSKNWY